MLSEGKIYVYVECKVWALSRIVGKFGNTFVLSSRLLVTKKGGRGEGEFLLNGDLGSVLVT